MSASSSSDGSLPSSASSSASAQPALMPAASVGPAVTMEDESTKRCSVCSEDRPVSAFSSAQLKKKGKRVCHACVNKRDAAAGAQQDAANTAAAAARKEAMKDAFAVRLNSTPTQTATACLCCYSKAAVRFAACARCTVECCSLSCFDRHDCDAYLEAKRTMPTELIPDEDRFGGEEDFLRGWKEVFDHACATPALVSTTAVEDLGRFVDELRVSDGDPWWNPTLCARLGFDPSLSMFRFVRETTMWVFNTAQWPSLILEECAKRAMSAADIQSEVAKIQGSSIPVPQTDIRSVCFLPGRLWHKLLTLDRWILRVMGPEWTQAHFTQPGDVSNDAFGIFPTKGAQGTLQTDVGYLETIDPDSGVRTLVPLVSHWSAASRFPSFEQHIGRRKLLMVRHDGAVVLDRGLYLGTSANNLEVNAVSGWTGNVADSFTVAPTRSLYWNDQWMRRSADDPDLSLVAEDDWPSTPDASLFIATPQLGIESELVELSLLESLVEDAAAGNEHARLLIAHIEEQCAAPIAEVIARQKSRLEQMLEDQAAQLRIHAEAVKRAEMRGRLRGPVTADEDDAEGPAASASVSASSVSALAPTSAASSSSSSSSAVSVVPAVPSAHSSSSLDGPAYSWTQSREYKGLESLRAPGRKKYSTIMSAAKRLLYSLRPVSVNKRGGSHIVFHFASGAPATLVQMHAGSRSKDSTAHTTRLFAQLSEVAMQQMGGAIEGAPIQASASAGAGVGRLLQ